MFKDLIMVIERTNSEIIIRIPSFVKTENLQQIIDFLTYSEATSQSKASEKDIEKLVKDVKKDWWKNNKARFLK